MQDLKNSAELCIEIITPTMIDGKVHEAGDVVTVPAGDAYSCMSAGRAKLTDAPKTKEAKAK